MNFILKRLNEPSTFAGIAALFASFGLLGLTETQWNELFGAIAVVSGIAAVVLEERNSDEDGDL